MGVILVLLWSAIIVLYLKTVCRTNWPTKNLNFADAYDSPQEAVDAYGDGNIILFHPGKYFIENPIRINKNNVTVKGLEGNKIYFSGESALLLDVCKRTFINDISAVGQFENSFLTYLCE